MRTIRTLAGCLLFLAACGGGGGSVDAGGGDAGNADSATNGPVTVNVWARGNPADAMTVMVHDPDGAFVKTVMTGATGSVTIDDFPAGGAVTVPTDAYGRPVTGYLTTITDVDIGDVLTIGKTPASRAPNSAGTLTVGFTGAFTGATQYTAMAGCDSGTSVDPGTPVLLSLKEVCVGTDVADVVGYAIDIAGLRIAHASAADVAFASGSTTLPAWQTTFGVWAIDASSPAGTMGVEGFHQGLRAGIPVDEGLYTGADISGSQSWTADVKLPSGFFTEAVAGVHVRYGDGTIDDAAIATRTVRTDAPPTDGAGDDLSVDLGSTDIFPEVSAVAVTDTSPLGVSFTAGGPLTCSGAGGPDAAIWAVVGEAPAAAQGGSAATTTWLVLSAGDLASGQQLPELDPDLAGTLWTEAAFTVTDAGVIWIADSTADYADIRGTEANFAIAQYAPGAAGTRCMLRSGRFGASARP